MINFHSDAICSSFRNVIECRVDSGWQLLANQIRIARASVRQIGTAFGALVTIMRAYTVEVAYALGAFVEFIVCLLGFGVAEIFRQFAQCEIMFAVQVARILRVTNIAYNSSGWAFPAFWHIKK